jgi:Ser/Thr protein kinase RdoA (MazF antagonist)
LNSSK